MSKKDITSREEVHLLVTTFYSRIRKDELLAPFFKDITDWDAHMETLTTFWESSLFLKTKYLGDPLTAHVKVIEFLPD